MLGVHHVAAPKSHLYHSCCTVILMVLATTFTAVVVLVLQCHNSPRPDNGLRVQMLLSEGFLGFYRGFMPVLAGVLPATMIYFSAYEAGKRSVPPRYGPAGDLAVGAFAQLTAGFVFTPVDIIKERMQVETASIGFSTMLLI